MNLLNYLGDFRWLSWEMPLNAMFFAMELCFSLFLFREPSVVIFKLFLGYSDLNFGKITGDLLISSI